jgi:hypothetical protein
MEAMRTLDSQGKFQGGWTSNPITGTISSVVAAPIQAAQSYTAGLSKTGEAASNIAQ